jgi:hydroxymethylglutaryl-CoA lyase
MSAHSLQSDIQIVEVGPRDGLQNEGVTLSSADKVELIARLIGAGITRIEAASFVSPRAVPQMADAETVIAGLDALPERRRASLIGLALNERGVDRALATSVNEINFALVATDTFNMANQGVTTSESIAQWERAAKKGKGTIPMGITIGAAFGCPFEGEVPVARVVEIAKRIAQSEPAEIALGDSIGVASPWDVTERVAAVTAAVGPIPIRCHFHNTRNTGIANAYAALNAGVRRLDASIGGMGGCPFAPRATGNIPTEDLVYMLDRANLANDISIPALISTAEWIAGRLGRTLPGMVMKAGPFPESATDAA